MDGLSNVRASCTKDQVAAINIEGRLHHKPEVTTRNAEVANMAEISDFTKDAVWNTLCDLEWHIRYFSAMHEQKRRRYRFIRLTLLLGVFLDGFLFFGSRDIQWLFYVAVALGVALAGLTIWDAVTNDATDAAASRIISAACRQLKRETEVLWRQIRVDAVAPDHVEATLQAIQSRWEATLQWAEPETDKGMNKATQLAANAEMAQVYGISTTA